MFQTLGLSQHELQNSHERLGVQGCFVDAQVFFRITTFSTLNNALEAELTFVSVSPAERVVSNIGRRRR